jgi:hypothetical protein
MVGGCLSGCSRGHCCRRAMSRAFHLWVGSGKKLHRVESVRQQGRAGQNMEGVSKEITLAQSFAANRA